PFFDSPCLARVTRSPTPGVADHLDEPITVARLWNVTDRVVVIDGKSGFGKTHAMRATILHWQKLGRICVFIAAGREEEPIVPLIARKLGLPDSSEDMLRSLVHVGAVRVIIDGLNE